MLAGCQSADEASPSATRPASLASSPAASASTVASESASASQSASAPAEESAEPSARDDGEEVSVFDIEAGDCFNANGGESADGEQLETVTVVDCEQPHVYEAYRVFDHDAGDDAEYPGDDEILAYADEACQPEFEEFVDHEYQTSIWYITSVTPSAETWAEGDREIVCTLGTENDDEVTGSAEGSAE
jgi:hypothetical protein